MGALLVIILVVSGVITIGAYLAWYTIEKKEKQDGD